MKIVQRYTIKDPHTQMYYEGIGKRWVDISDATLYLSDLEAIQAIETCQIHIFGGNSVVPAVTIETIYYPI